MNEDDLRPLHDEVTEIRDSQQDILRNINNMLYIVANMERQFNRHYNLAFVLEELRTKLEAVNVDNVFEFVDDLELKIDNISYNYKKAEKANNTSVYRIRNK